MRALVDLQILLLLLSRDGQKTTRFCVMDPTKYYAKNGIISLVFRNYNSFHCSAS